MDARHWTALLALAGLVACGQRDQLPPGANAISVAVSTDTSSCRRYRLNRTKRPEALDEVAREVQFDRSRGPVALGPARTAARADLSAGVLAVPWEGLPRSVDFVAEHLLRERYGIQMWPMGDQIDGTTGAMAEGYGGVTAEEAKRCFGADVFERTYADAEVMTFKYPDDWLNCDSVFAAVADAAWARDLRGRVILRVTPGKRGHFEQVDVVRSDDPALDSVALRIVRLSRLRALPEAAPPQVTFALPVGFRRDRAPYRCSPP